MCARRLNLPDTASVANPGTDGRLFAPSAARNIEAIIGVLQRFAPKSGQALEIASGTGEHVIRFADAFPDVTWHPTDVDPARIASIESWATHSKCRNVMKPRILDAGLSGWSRRNGPFELVVAVNILHLVSLPEAETILREAAATLSAGAYLAVYGPFMRGSGFASDGDARFHASLSSQDPEIGYKPFELIQSLQAANGLEPLAAIEMPANNLILAARKPDRA